MEYARRSAEAAQAEVIGKVQPGQRVWCRSQPAIGGIKFGREYIIAADQGAVVTVEGVVGQFAKNRFDPVQRREEA